MEGLVSVIVPVYNVEPYLEQCVESILAQTYENLEIILVDDGSTDKSGEICDRYAEKDSRIRVIHQENAGVSVARNTGLDICRGDYIGFVDSDDYIASDMYEVLLTRLRKDKAVIGACAVSHVSPHSVQAEGIGKPYAIFSGAEAAKSLFNPDKGFLDGVKFSVCNKLYRRNVFFSGNQERITFPEGKILGEDAHVTTSVIYHADRVVYIGKNLYFYRQRRNSATHSFNAGKFLSCQKSFSDLYRWTEKEAPDLRTYVEHRNLRVFSGLVNDYIKQGVYPLWLDDLNRVNDEIVKQTGKIFSAKEATRKEIKMYLFMKFGLFIWQKRAVFWLKGLFSKKYRRSKE